MAKILLVDDSNFQRKNVAKLLTNLGHEVITAENGQTSLKRTETERPDLIITDLLMPVMDGISYLRALKSKNILIPIIVASADIQETTRRECLGLGARLFLTKPVNSDDLESAVTRSLGISAGESAKC